MDKGLKEFIKNLCRDNSRKIVGRICKQIEILQEKDDLSEEQKLSLLKAFNKELIYEEFRDLRNAIIFYSEGRDYKKIPIYTPHKES